MKRLKHTLIGLITVLLLGSQGCNSFLNVDIPDQLLKEDYWKTKDQLDAALNGVYVKLGDNILKFLVWGDVRSDIYASNNGTYQNIIKQDIRTTNSTAASWSDVYVGINWANSFLKNAEEVLKYDQSVTAEEVASMKSEVYAIRALYYFYLVRAFQDVPVYLEPYESDTQEAYGPAVPQEQVYAQIESDLEKALAHAPLSFPQPTKNYGRITQKAVKAIWADVKLWLKQYDECIQFCNDLEEIYKNKMLTRETWFSQFATGNSSESIFEYQYVDEKRPSPVADWFRNSNTFYANNMAIRNSFRKVYPASGSLVTNDTVRYPRSYYGTMVFKYAGVSAEGGTYVMRDAVSAQKMNFIFYRFREVLLMKAEALAMKGQFDAAVESINMIRRASEIEEAVPADYGKGEMFFDKLLCERIAELGFEGKQWFSMVRMALNTGYESLVINRVATVSQYVKEQTMRARLSDQRGWFMPYLKSEVENNLQLKQKPFYLGKD